MKFPFARKPEKEGDAANDRYMDEGFYRGDEDENEGIVDDGVYDDLKPAEPAPVIRWDEPTVKTGGEEDINEEIETDEKLAAAEDEFPKQ